MTDLHAFLVAAVENPDVRAVVEDTVKNWHRRKDETP